MNGQRTLPPLSGSTLAGLSERELWRRFACKERFVYAVRFTSGIVKVGYTDYPERRYGQLAWAAGVPIARAWASVLHLNAIDNERELIAFCTREGRHVGRTHEFFEGLDLASVVAFAAGLPYRQTPDAEVDARIARQKQWIEDGCPISESVRRATPGLALTLEESA